MLRSEDQDAEMKRRHPLWVWFVPLSLMAGLSLTFIIAPAFYLKYVLYWKSREFQVVEIITFGSAFLASVLLAWSGWRAWNRNASLWRQGGAGIIALIALASFFFAGEEVSWGQTWFGWETPETMQVVSGETNLHNIRGPISVQGLGSLFLVVMFFGLPLVWRLEWPRKLPSNWSPAIAEVPVIFSMACAFAWKEVKNIYQLVHPDYEDIQTYHDFFEQINEHKEMLVAVTLLMYGVYRVKAVGSGRIESSGESGDSGGATDSAAASAG